MKSLLSVVRQAFPDTTSYDTLATVVQANAEGHRLLIWNDDNNNNNDNVYTPTIDDVDGTGSGSGGGLSNFSTKDIFVKQVDAAKYAPTKSWPDFRRTMMYLRTEVRFYKEIVPYLNSSKKNSSDREAEAIFPKVYFANYDLDGIIEEEEKATDQSILEPTEWSADGRGGSIIMESISEPYFQDSPITIDQAKETLTAIAFFHASAWEDQELLERAEMWLSRGSYHLKTRNTKELEGMEEAWESFSKHFQHLDSELFERTRTIGTRIKNLAERISDEVSPGPSDSYATLSHGDFKAMNCFLPNLKGKPVKLVDFASTGVGLGMSDVAMHIHHAVLPEYLSNGGEELLIDHYLATLNSQLGPSRTYSKDIAMHHYHLAVADYFRFFLGRFWKSATPESFDKKKDSKNTALINRNVDSALAFLNRADKSLRQIEASYDAKK